MNPNKLGRAGDLAGQPSSEDASTRAGTHPPDPEVDLREEAARDAEEVGWRSAPVPAKKRDESNLV